ncbi:uncharacterized protein LOC132258728 [Phlebotomus argentipes]|uniref:uncharacterized protein LOC132258728 n=1 Tax=Phlebotomus argentipes TaxID=94469 RepID=UPI002892E114|nr:uncharacterized protein LOC132258728 [Phlebotomus argentipes]
MSFGQFMKKNIVLVVMVPSIFGIHYLWSSIQNVDSLVKEHERGELPIVIGAKKLYNQYFPKPADPKQEDR